MHITKREAVARLRCGLASLKDLEFLGADGVRAVKGDGDGMQWRFGEHGARAVESEDGDEESRTFEHYASTEHVDSMGDIIRVNGWDTKRIRTGRISLQWAHEYDTAPLGLVRSAKRGACDDGVKALVTVSRFHEPDIYAGSEWGKHVATVLNLVRSGDLPGVSVGFAVRDYKWPDPEEREALGLGPYGVVFSDVELLELSVTPVPANGRANLKKQMGAYQKALGSLVEAKQLTQADMDELLSQLAASSETWAERLAASMPRALVAARSLPSWMAGARSGQPSSAPALNEADLVERIAAGVVRRVAAGVSQASRDFVEPAEDAMNACVERLEAATADLERAAKRTARVETGPDKPNGTEDGEGAEQESGARPSALRALEALSLN